MGEDLVSRLVARSKALGLVAATALTTAALVGGGAVAVTTVSSESPSGSAAVAGAGDDGQRSDTATVKIRDKRPRNVAPPACGSARNHGAYVSGVARSASPGPSHGPTVSAAAKAGCGKPAGARAGKAAKEAGKAKPGRPDSPGKSADKGPAD